MKHLSLLRHIGMACAVASAMVAVSSCSSTVTPNSAVQRLQTSSSAVVFSYNDANSPRARVCEEAGPLPERAARALKAWLRSSTTKSFSYAYPQYYLALTNGRTGAQSVWGICSDGHGNLVGILIPRNGVAAWDLPFVGEYRVLVCDTRQRKGLSDAIMESLADAGYDATRINARKASGLTQKRYLISKPLSDEAQKKYDLIKKAEEQAQAARDAKATTPAGAPVLETTATPDSSVEEAVPVSDSDSSTDEDDDFEL